MAGARPRRLLGQADTGEGGGIGGRGGTQLP